MKIPLKRMQAAILLAPLLIGGMSGASAGEGRDLDVDVVTLKDPVSAGENAELTIKTEIGAMCLGSAWLEAQPSQRARLSGTTVHGQGRTTWSWPIPKDGAAGRWTIDLQCATSEKKARLHLLFEVR